MKLVIYGTPVTKKNSQRIGWRGNRPVILPSERFEEYQRMAGRYIPVKARLKLSERVNVKCLYFMPTRRRVDLVNLLEATCDILVHYGVLADDSSDIVASHDGSRVKYDRDSPRVEIFIEEKLEMSSANTFCNNPEPDERINILWEK